MRKFVFGLTALAFAAGSLLGTSSASALTAVEMFNLGGGALVTADDVSREFLEKGSATGPNTVDVGDRLTGVLAIESMQYGNGSPTLSPGGSNEWIVAVFSAEVVSKVADAPSGWTFGFAAPGGGDGTLATVYSLPGATAFDIAVDSYASLNATFTSGAKLFDVNQVAANGDFWVSSAPSDDITEVTVVFPVTFGFQATLTDVVASINFASDTVLGNGKAFENTTPNQTDFPLANDIDLFFEIEGESSVIPEPATAGLLGLGLLGALGMRRRRTA